MSAGAVSSVDATSGVVDLVPGRVYALGGTISLDGRVSWVPAHVRGAQPLHAYLVVSGDAAVLIDAGVAALGDQIVEQLGTIVLHGKELSVLLTRTELDCVTGLAAIERSFNVAAVHYTGGITLPLCRPKTAVHRHSIPAGGSELVEIAPGIELELIAPRLRLLPALWPYDRVSRTLFTSDLFGHTVCGSDGERLLRVDDDDVTTPSSLKEHLLAKFSWLEGAMTAGAADHLHEIVASRPIDVVAPSHGRVLMGSETVARHALLLEQAVREVGR